MNTTINLDAVSLEIGETSYQFTCPHCNVGNGSFSLTRTRNGALYNCFRAKCGKGGSVSLDGTVVVKEREEFKPNPYLSPSSTVSDRVYQHLWNKYFITREEIKQNDMAYAYLANELLIPLRNSRMELVGTCTKALPGHCGGGVVSLSKSRIFKTEDTPRLYFPVQNMSRGGPIVIVEDMLSAVRVSRIAKCAALLGTSLSMDAAIALRGLSSKVIVALDPDVWKPPVGSVPKVFIPAPIRMKNKYSLMFKEFKIVSLSADPKDLSPFKLGEELRL